MRPGEGAAILEYQNDGMTARKAKINALHGGEEKTFTQSLVTWRNTNSANTLSF